ncbi:MAG: DUF4252 domain-containing protein [Cyclobacteriaceae bacterium]|nr:DUF4252 domain-containing protein [Cyclobacteriaceae bacterium]
MKITLITGLFLFALIINARSQAVEKFHEKFKDDSKYLCVSIESGLLKLLSNVKTEDKDTDEFLKAMAGINSVNIYKIDRNESSFDEASLRSFKKDIQKEKYEELMVVREGNTHLDFMVKENKGKISDLIMMVDEMDGFFLLTFSGEIDLATISRLSDKLDIDGVEHLKKIDKKD